MDYDALTSLIFSRMNYINMTVPVTFHPPTSSDQRFRLFHGFVYIEGSDNNITKILSGIKTKLSGHKECSEV